MLGIVDSRATQLQLRANSRASFRPIPEDAPGISAFLKKRLLFLFCPLVSRGLYPPSYRTSISAFPHRGMPFLPTQKSFTTAALGSTSAEPPGTVSVVR